MAFSKTRVAAGSKVDLSKIDPDETFGWKKENAKTQTQANLERIAELQELMHFEGKHSLLIVLQAMDTGGKDGTVRVLGGAMNPAGVRVVSFKQPTKEELANGFMWRIENAAPKKPKHLRREDDPRLSKEPTPEPPSRSSSRTQQSTSVHASGADRWRSSPCG